MAKPVVTLCGTYTLDPAADALGFWFEFLELEANAVLAPYAQLYQQLLDPASGLHSNREGANAVLLRWVDLLETPSQPGFQRDWVEVEPRVAELALALQAFDQQVPCLVLVGPADEPDPVLQHATDHLRSLLAGTPGLTVEQGENVMQRYRVQRVHDRVSDRFGHVPYTPEAMAALGTAIARWYAALVRRPVKLVAVDGDHTLWAGVVAEDGADGIRVGTGHEALQRALVQQADGGRLLCLLSKNEESDVRAVFQRHHGMPLQWSQLVAQRIDWNPKPANLQVLVGELELGLDSVLFLDDNPIECAQMRACCPSVATVRVPDDTAGLADFVEHLWLFDQPGVTAEDRGRTRMYADNRARNQLRHSADSLQAFLDKLELVVEITPPSAKDMPRLAQLTMRTNQFNASLIRCDEHQLAGDSAGPGRFHCLVRASDRFGDYGIVGQVRARVDDGCLAVDLFMLSCRALGRGIEHRMIAAVGEHALALGLQEVAVLFRRGERNAPAESFLDAMFGNAERAGGDEHWFRLPASVAARANFDASTVRLHAETASSPSWDTAPQPARSEAAMADEPADIGARYELIAHTLNTGARIEQAMARRVRPRADLASGYVAPAPGLEREVASIWQEALRVDKVGSRDRFQDLGGRSLHLVKVHALLLERLGVDLDITTLFQHATVASLAAHLAGRADSAVTDAARQRGSRIRAARARADIQRAGASS